MSGLILYPRCLFTVVVISPPKYTILACNLSVVSSTQHWMTSIKELQHEQKPSNYIKPSDLSQWQYKKCYRPPITL